MSSSASTSASSAGSRKRRFEKENKTILSSVLPEDESDEDYVDEESDDSVDDEVIDGEHEIIYIDDDEVDIPSLPGESKIDSAQVDAWAGSLPGNKAVPHRLAREIVRSEEKSRGMNKRQRLNGSRSSDTKISAASRVHEFPNEYLEARSGKLFLRLFQAFTRHFFFKKTTILTTI